MDDNIIVEMKPKRRVILCIAVVIILLLGSFITAMAVSEEFREAVFTFFNLAVPEVVPEIRPNPQSGDSDYNISEVNINEFIQAKYIWISGRSSSGNGMFRCSKDKIVYKRGSHFDLYGEKDGELIPIETHAINMDYDWNGKTYPIELEWGADGKNLAFAYVADDGDNGWYFSCLPDHPDAVMITFEHALPGKEDDAPAYSAYPMLFDLENQVIIDILDGCGVENLPGITNAAFSDDFTKALFALQDGTLYYCDIHAGQLYSVDELSGERADACTFVGNHLTCWALDENGRYHCWNNSLSSFERTEVFEDIPAYDKSKGYGLVFISGFDTMHHSGYAYTGSCFALSVKEDKSVYVIDLSTGEQIIIDGFLWPDIYGESSPAYMECISNPTGTRLLIVERDTSSAGYGHFGVVDYASGSYIRLARENFSINEQAIYWFDTDRIIIATDTDKAGGGAYIYTIKNPPNTRRQENTRAAQD